MKIQNKLLIGLILLGLMTGSLFAQINFTPTGKTIAELARKASYQSPVSGSGKGISGTFTPAKISSEELKNLSNGAFIGQLDLNVTGKDYGKLRTGKFDLLLTSEKNGLRLYLEEKEKIAAVLEVTEQTPEGYKELKSSDDPSINFPLPEAEISGLFGLPNFQPDAVFSFSNNASFRRCKIYIKIYIGKKGYWVWSGATRECGTPAR